jgi:putative ABC transport system substrate-binding protein
VRRRDFTAGLFIAASTRSVWAQMPAKQHLIVFVFGAGPAASWRENPFWQPFFSELRGLGYVEGNNLVVETLTAVGHFESYADVAQQAVSRNPDVIVAGENPLVVALRSATRTIPIVGLMAADALGLVAADAARGKKPGAGIGMTAEEVKDGTSWGRPNHINRTITANGISEQWVYGGGYLYFNNGILTAMQTNNSRP